MKPKKEKPLFLRSGDLIDLIDPGFSFDRSRLPAMKELVRSWGYELRYPFEHRQIDDNKEPYHAWSDADRFQLLKTALVGSPSRMIWCARGGYGANRLIAGLHKIKKPKHEKIFLGFSDNSSLHLFLNQKWGWTTYHGPHLDRVVDPAFPMKKLQRIQTLLNGSQLEFHYELAPFNSLAEKPKKLVYPLRGGNLATLTSWAGTPLQVILKDRFLFLEDTGERGYKLDRMLFQLQASGSMKGCRGVILGPFIGGADPSGQDHTQYAVRRWAETLRILNIPVWGGISSGHGSHFDIVPFEKKATIILKNNPGKNPKVLLSL